MTQMHTLSVLGTMSGTSLDGADAAVLETDGVTIHGFGPSAYRPYDEEERAILRAALGKWEGEAVDAAEMVVMRAHLELLAGFDFAAVDLVGLHGQTLAHDPGGRGTLQAGDGAALARALGRPVIWDFRSADIRAGGQGAPLAPFFHFACAKWIKADAPLAFVNLGGVGNLTWIDPQAPAPEADNALFAFDTGPANAPLDDLVQGRLGWARDEGGTLAASGRVDEAVVTHVLRDPYFAVKAPKSLDRNAFAGLDAQVAHLDTADAAATLAAVAAAAVARGLTLCPIPPARLLVTGGGRHNCAIMAELARRTECATAPIEAVELDGDVLEAQAFAYLAARSIQGLPLSAPGTTGVAHPVNGGRSSQPNPPL